MSKTYILTGQIAPATMAKSYVGDDGIYIPSVSDPRCHTMLISRELFVEAYSKWIKDEENNQYLGCCEDDADCWCE